MNLVKLSADICKLHFCSFHTRSNEHRKGVREIRQEQAEKQESVRVFFLFRSGEDFTAGSDEKELQWADCEGNTAGAIQEPLSDVHSC